LVATLLVEAGVDPKVTQDRMGHEDIRTTFKYYVRGSASADAAAAASVESRLRSGCTPVARPDSELAETGGASKNRTYDLSIISAAL